MNVAFCLQECSSTKIVTWKFNVDKSIQGRYNMILCRYLLTTLGMYLKFSDNVIIGGEEPYEGCLPPIVDVSNYYFTYLMDKIVKPE